MKLNEVRKEEDLYYSGPFWVKANSFDDIMDGNFELIGEKIFTDYEGKYVDFSDSKRSLIHSTLWKNKYQRDYPNKPYNYYPRGRIVIFKGRAYININSLCNNPKVIDKIIKEYDISKLNCSIKYNDSEGSHYDFLLA